MNRAQRRMMKKVALPARDPDAEYKAGFSDGFKAASPGIIETIYAAIALATHDLYGHGHKRVTRTLNAVNDHVMRTLASKEIIDEVWEQIGLVLDFGDPLDFIKEREDKK